MQPVVGADIFNVLHAFIHFVQFGCCHSDSVIFDSNEKLAVGNPGANNYGYFLLEPITVFNRIFD